MPKLLVLILILGLFTSCEVNTQDWRAKTKTGVIVILDDLERGYKAGDTVIYGNSKVVLLELVSK